MTGVSETLQRTHTGSYPNASLASWLPHSPEYGGRLRSRNNWCLF